MRAVTQVMRDNGMGGTYWPALGGKHRHHRLRLVLDVRQERQRHQPQPDHPQHLRRRPPALRLGRRGRPAGTARVHGRHDRQPGLRQVHGRRGRARPRTRAEVIQYTCGTAAPTSSGTLRRRSATATTTSSRSTRASAWTSTAPRRPTAPAIIQYTCGSGTNQQWQLRSVGGGYISSWPATRASASRSRRLDRQQHPPQAEHLLQRHEPALVRLTEFSRPGRHTRRPGRTASQTRFSAGRSAGNTPMGALGVARRSKRE